MKQFLRTPVTLLASAAVLALSMAPAHAVRNKTSEAANRLLVSNFVSGVISAKDPELVALQVAPNMIQHDALYVDGRRGMVDWINKLRSVLPLRTMTVKHMLADGDMVFVQTHLSDKPASEFGGTNRYDFYRVDHGSIVEHWAFSGKAPTRSANGNSQFSDVYQYPDGRSLLTEEQVEFNRLFVKGLSEEVFNKRNFGVIDRLWNVNYLQHNPSLPSGRAPLAAVIASFVTPGSTYKVALSVAEGDLSVVCAQSLEPEEPKSEFAGYAVCDMYRVANFELVEHWDVAQAVAANSLNGHSMFSSLYRTPPRHGILEP